MIAQPPEWMLGPLMPIYRHLLTNLAQIAAVDSSAVATSWYRSAEKNASVGGSPESQHLFGFAVDVVSDRPQQVVEVARALGLYPVLEFDHVHIQTFPAGFLRQIGFFS